MSAIKSAVYRKTLSTASVVSENDEEHAWWETTLMSCHERHWNPPCQKKKEKYLKVLVFKLGAVILFRWHNFCFKCKSGRSSVSADICFDRWTHHVPFKTKACGCGGQRLPPPSETACWNWENICCFNEYRVVRLSSFFHFFFKEIIWWLISSLETQQHSPPPPVWVWYNISIAFSMWKPCQQRWCLEAMLLNSNSLSVLRILRINT